ncbi:MAG: phage tail tape measure protein [Blautia obeum]|nr:phage tail tape measure protein [Blautia obeum]
MGKGRIAGITVEIDGSTTGLDKAIKGTQSNISSVQRSLKDVNRLLKIDPSNTELLSQKQKLLSQAIQETKEKLEIEKEALRQAAEQDIPPDKMDALKREVIATTQELESLEKQARNSSSVLGAQMQEAGKKISEAGDKVKNVGEGLTKNVTTPILAAGAAAGVAWNQVDEGMDTVVAKTGATGDALKEMQDIAKEIPQTINVGFDEAGAAVGEVNTRFGATGDKLKELSTQFLEFSKLNQTDVSTSIDATQAAMEAFGISVDDAGGFLDTLNAVGQRTGADVIQLAQNMTTNAAALKEMGFSASDAANFLGNLEVAGIDSSTVLTGLKKALANAAEEGKPMSQALEEVQGAMENATTSQDAMQYAMELFGTKAGPAIAEACSNGQLSFDELGTSINDNLGNIKTTFDNTQDPIDKFQTTMNTMKIVGADLATTFGEMITPMLENLASKAQELKEKWDGLSQGQQEMIVKVAGLAAAIGPITIMIGTLTSSIGTVVSSIGKLKTFLGGLSGAAEAAGGGLTLFSSPMLPIIATIAGVVAAGVLLYQNWDTIKEKASEVAQKAQEKWEGLKTSTLEGWENLKAGAQEKWEGVKTSVTEKVASAKDTAVQGWNMLASNTSQVWTSIQASVQANGGGIQGIIATAVQGYQNIWSIGFNAIDSITGGKLSSALSTAQAKLSSIKQAFTDKMDGAKNAVHNAIENIKSKFNFSWKLPDLKLPHINIKGSFSLSPPSVPEFGISWYKKAMDSAYLLDGASIFGSMNGNLLAGGESGKEMIVGQEYLLNMIQEANAKSNAEMMRTIGYMGNQMIEMMNHYFPEFAKQKIAIPMREMNRQLRSEGVVFR